MKVKTENNKILIINDDTGVEVLGGDIIDSRNLFAGTEPLYSIDENGIVTRDPDADYKIKMADVRLQRNGLLSMSDWTQLPDVPLTEQQKAAWATYRQALRDLPNQEGFDPDDFEWPEQP